MLRFFVILFLLIKQGSTFGQCTSFSNIDFLNLESRLKNNINVYGDKTIGINYSKFYFDHKNGNIHIIKTINLKDSFEVRIDTAFFNGITSNNFGTINTINFSNEIIEVLSITTKETTFLFTSTNGCQMIDLLPNFINQNFIGNDKFELIITLIKNLSCN